MNQLPLHELLNCSFCGMPPEVGIDPIELYAYIRCVNKDCITQPGIGSYEVYGDLQQIRKQLAPKWNNRKNNR